MNKKTVLLLILAIGLVISAILVLLRPQQNSLRSPQTNQPEVQTKILPSETFKVYTDPSGFSFSYPDNLSLTNNQIEDIATYADIKLSLNGVNGSLSLKIADSKFKSIDEWVKVNNIASNITTKEVRWGDLKALEIKLNDRLLVGALDQGVLFTIEMPLVEEDFWMKVYNKMLADFSLGNVSPLSDEVIFEGEEVVE